MKTKRFRAFNEQERYVLASALIDAEKNYYRLLRLFPAAAYCSQDWIKDQLKIARSLARELR